MKTMEEVKGLEEMKKITAGGRMRAMEAPEGAEVNQTPGAPKEAEVNQIPGAPKEAEVDQVPEVPEEAGMNRAPEVPEEAGVDLEERQKELAKKIRHQMRVIRQGAADLIGEEELEQKVRDSILTGKPLTIKFGMDPSAPDIHVGHAVPLRKLKQMQDLGHNIVVVIAVLPGKFEIPKGKGKGEKG